MDFYVYDNVMTFNKRLPDNKVNNRFEINQIKIPENGSFWFYTDMILAQSNFNIQKRYVHIHPGVGTTNKMRFKKEPFEITRGNLIYNPKEKRVEVKNSILPWKKPLYAKKCIYYGAELPSKKMSIIGTWFFDFSTNSIHFIIDYFPQKIKFHWEDDPTDNVPTFGQISRVEELEHQIAEVEKKLSSNSSSSV